MSKLTSEEIRYFLEQIIEDQQNLRPATESTFEDLGMDSLDVAELIMQCEKKYLINIPDQEIEAIQNFGELVDLISDKLQAEKPIDPKPSLKTKVFESLGAASMCWNPRPSTNVFDSTTAEKIGNELMEAIESDIPNAIKVLQKELAKDKLEGSYYYSWQANMAMAFVDAYKKDFGESPKMSVLIHEISNNAAKNFLDLLISQTK